MALWNWVRASRRRTALTVIFVALAIPALALAWWLGSPLFLDKTVNEDFPVVAGAANVPGEPVETTAIALQSGRFRDEDNFHRGSGLATVYELADSSQTLRLEDFSVTNGPDLFVLLMKDPEGRDTDRGYIDLGRLKGNRGNQNYDIPAGTDLSEYKAVMIYCKAFHVVFSTAPLMEG